MRSVKLSMWLINHYLKDVFHTIPVIVSAPTLRTIESVRLFAFDDLRDFSTEHVYIGRQSDFFRTDPEETLLASGNDLIFVDCADITEVFNFSNFSFKVYSFISDLGFVHLVPFYAYLSIRTTVKYSGWMVIDGSLSPVWFVSDGVELGTITSMD